MKWCVQSSHHQVPVWHGVGDKWMEDGDEAVGVHSACEITPSEFWFCAMTGREGLIDTAFRIAEIGYVRRCLVKALEDANAWYGGSVRDSLSDIVPFIYGQDGTGAVIGEKSA